MCDYRAFVEALRDFHADIVAGKFSRHVGAFVLKKAHDGTCLELQDVPSNEWLMPEANETELDDALNQLLSDVLKGDPPLSLVAATEILQSVHSHVGIARKRLRGMSISALDGMSAIAAKLARHPHSEVGIFDTIGKTWDNRTLLTEQYYRGAGLAAVDIQTLMNTLMKLPIHPTQEAA